MNTKMLFFVHIQVRHLETSTSAMATDLIEKSKIIEHYVMDSKTGGIFYLCSKILIYQESIFGHLVHTLDLSRAVISYLNVNKIHM